MSVPLSAESADNIQARLQHLADRDGIAVLQAIYWLPESRDWFISCVGESHHWLVASAQEFEKALSTDQRTDVFRAVATRLAGLTDDERRSYLDRLNRWLVSYVQIHLMLRFHAIETVEEAIIAHPATRPAYDTIVANRGFDPPRVSPGAIAETMTSGETDMTLHTAITLMSSFDDVDLMRYFGDLYDKLATCGVPVRWYK
jgi:hypothetical protein